MRRETLFRIIAIVAGFAIVIATTLYVHGLKPSNSNPPPQKLSYQPSGSLFGLTNIRYVVLSPYAYEANLLDGSAPVADIDYLLPYAAQELVTLPGTRYDTYYYRGAVYVQGSGWVQKWQANGGGRFAFLHLSRLYTPIPQGAPYIPGPGPQPYDGKDETARSVAATVIIGTGRSQTASQYVGGTPVGVSGWPSWSQYANGGNPGPSDAHLCLLLDQLSVDWFFRVATGQDNHAPKTFPIKLWNAYTTGHHLKAISPYYHGTLSWAASYWWHHAQWLRGVKDRGHYYGDARTGYTQTAFSKGNLRCWNLYKKCRASVK